MQSKTVQKFIDFNASSPTPYHCVLSAIKQLNLAGFTRRSLNETTHNSIKPLERFYFSVRGTTLVAISAGKHYRPGNGATIIAAHTDSPCLQAKPISKGDCAGLKTVSLQTYGGGHFDSWFDRDLGVAGNAIFAHNNDFVTKLFNINRPIMTIPRLAIHLKTIEERNNGFKPNLETHLKGVSGLITESKSPLELKGKHCERLLETISDSVGEKRENLRNLRLTFFDTQPPKLGGIDEEFVFAARLDNQLMSFVALQALINSLDTINDENGLRIVALFDNEEVGSKTDRGADSRLLFSVLENLVGPKVSDCINDSFVISADMAHAEHPNYPEKHSDGHRPKMGGGLVIKHNANERYATTEMTSFFIEEIARKNNLPLQHFCARQDGRTGSTVGPLIASGMGIPTVDVGISQLAMHSVREVCAVKDIESSTELLKCFYEQFRDLKGRVKEQ